MKKLLFFTLLYSSPLFADTIVIYSTTTNRVQRFNPSQDPSPYVSRVDALIFNDTTSQTESQVLVLTSTTPIRYFKKTGTPQIAEMTASEKLQVDADIKADRIAASRISALADLLQIGSAFARDRALVLLSKDEINLIRQWITAFKVEVSSSTSLNDFKTRVSTLPNMPDRTSTQAKTALQNIITSGQADE